MLRHKVKPEDVTCTLHWLPTADKGDFTLGFRTPFKVHHFNTKRTTKDCLLMGAEIIKQRKEMEEYIKNHVSLLGENIQINRFTKFIIGKLYCFLYFVSSIGSKIFFLNFAGLFFVMSIVKLSWYSFTLSTNILYIISFTKLDAIYV
jgi:hypothetical protein